MDTTFIRDTIELGLSSYTIMLATYERCKGVLYVKELCKSVCVFVSARGLVTNDWFECDECRCFFLGGGKGGFLLLLPS